MTRKSTFRPAQPFLWVVDEDFNLPEKRRPRRLMANQVFRYRYIFGNEISRKG
ncbi:MAG: hypothetical protein M0R67_01645 [Candidatus Cloacimonas sp.]|nr:hypothetical protein [Candidatus Cloacimonas sp.]